MDALVRAAVIARACGLCECRCGHPLRGRGELDHFFGRAKATETLENCWFLRLECAKAKTDNKPDAATWHERFIEHCRTYGYVAPGLRAGNRLVLLRYRDDTRDAERSKEAAAAARRAAQGDESDVSR